MRYSEEQRRKATAVYDETKSVAETRAILGYPVAEATLYTWIRGLHGVVHTPKSRPGTPDNPGKPSREIKLILLRRCFEQGESVKTVAEETGYSDASLPPAGQHIYLPAPPAGRQDGSQDWRRTYVKEGVAGLMKTQKHPKMKIEAPWRRALPGYR